MTGELSVRLDDRRIVVTGAAGGIGAAVQKGLEASGATVIGADASPRDGHVRCDVSSEEDVVRLFADAVAAGGVTDVVHAAGICRTSTVDSMALEDWEAILKVNLTGSFLVARQGARALPGGGSIVFISSVAGLTGDPLYAAYCASKFGVVALTQVLARELGHRRIRVNAVCPGGVRTAMSDETIRRDAARLGRSEAQLRELYESDSFLDRWADPEEVADACLFLLSSGASYVSGHSLVLNGGGNLSSHR